jgi:hypothetical protein
MEESEEEDGWEAISTHDSGEMELAWACFAMGRGILPSLRSRGGIPVERDMASVFLD